MRNILEYPITQAEKVEVLTTLAEDILSEKRMGDMRPAVLRAVIADITPKTRAKATPRKPPAEIIEPGDVIAGPRVPLAYGSAATAIRLSTRQWRMVEHGDEETWIGIDDYTNADNIIGKRVSFTVGRQTLEGIAQAPEERDEAFSVDVGGMRNAFAFYDAKQVNVINDPLFLNPFEKVIVGHLTAGLMARHDPAISAVIEQARQYRLDMKHRISVTGGSLRASLLKEFGWTEADLKEVN